MLVRDPFSSVLAEFNRRSGGHIGHASRDKFRKENGKFWREFVLSKGKIKDSKKNKRYLAESEANYNVFPLLGM